MLTAIMTETKTEIGIALETAESGVIGNPIGGHHAETPRTRTSLCPVRMSSHGTGSASLRKTRVQEGFKGGAVTEKTVAVTKGSAVTAAPGEDKNSGRSSGPRQHVLTTSNKERSRENRGRSPQSLPTRASWQETGAGVFIILNKDCTLRRLTGTAPSELDEVRRSAAGSELGLRSRPRFGTLIVAKPSASSGGRRGGGTRFIGRNADFTCVGGRLDDVSDRKRGRRIDTTFLTSTDRAQQQKKTEDKISGLSATSASERKLRTLATACEGSDPSAANYGIVDFSAINKLLEMTCTGAKVSSSVKQASKGSSEANHHAEKSSGSAAATGRQTAPRSTSEKGAASSSSTQQGSTTMSRPSRKFEEHPPSSRGSTEAAAEEVASAVLRSRLPLAQLLDPTEPLPPA
ncbi:hypothetical protein HPB52_024597 [Rhipicephalus sanguineus]|uniref:Uncharacterized protein n=1 Tax=Rhipicephalus sanguineus TaxID=34632 RepID=A0A9D4TE39_RHISA|nr:hypothetical protein HPB52_024597 [Rhipicephalus sanguineus]